jgi:GTP-binding protein LepA
VTIVLVTPHSYYGEMVEVLKDRRADNLEIVYLDDGTIKVTALVPWQEVVCDMYDQVGPLTALHSSLHLSSD